MNLFSPAREKVVSPIWASQSSYTLFLNPGDEMRDNRGPVAGDPYGRRSTISKRSAFSDESYGGGGSGSSSGRRSIVRRAATALGSCFAPRTGTASESWGWGANRDLSEVSQVPSDISGASGPNNSRRGIYGISKNFTHNEPGPGGMTFTLSEIKRATNNFSPSKKVGQGGFGIVYKGVLNGKVVAIKRGKKSMYDKHVDAEFKSEISTLARIEHLNLVKFMGYIEDGEERIVVVEYVPNGTLREHLDGTRGGTLDLTARLDIAVDVAHAVTYLHMYADHPIIHRDIKASNILLMDNLRAKVADFGFARMGPTNDGETHIHTQIKGTAGYMDPEYLQTYQLTEKSDVYSFGVLLVELVSGRRPIESKREMKERLTARWAMKKFMDGNATEVLDPNLMQNPAVNLAIEQMLELALQCLSPTKQPRPSMRRCAEILWSIRKDYREQVASSDTLSQFSYSQTSDSRRIDPTT